ncbi:NAD-dependent dehydratase [Pseudomonas sp. Leaf48]|uniref:UDP-glucose 4-epimerase family protein n=1 Tax=Pseudomonas sp. Leaf48 TaxID=1736221 RepID=UPI0007289829|nr:SDR family oxidoreductase [Pseudomonas sp. Leaf48]KQN47104.1 NAD-dependent dehydratase [Pseudomonas sp. Leaf48]
MSKNVFLTGATGFVGGATLRCLLARNYTVIVALRNGSQLLHNQVSTIHVDSIDGATSWKNGLIGVDIVIHTAARVHVMNDADIDPLAAFRRVNVEGTVNLARQAASAGVRRFIFISSIKVNGESTNRGITYSPDDTPAPADSYGISKMEAEERLRELAMETGMEVVVIRPVLVYGPGVKANFLSMIRWLDKGFPLPFGAIHNSRSFVAVDNLVDLIVTCIIHPAAANQTFLVSDGEDLSTTQLLRKIALGLGRTARLVPIPTGILRGLATLVGKKALTNRLCGSLQVDISKTRSLLGWKPPVSADDALRATARYFIESK